MSAYPKAIALEALVPAATTAERVKTNGDASMAMFIWKTCAEPSLFENSLSVAVTPERAA